MRSQVDEAYAAADRLVREAEAAARARTSEVPPAGYEGERTSAERSAFGDLQALAGLLDVARTSVPPGRARRLAGAAGGRLVALRALIDWWIARLEREPDQPVGCRTFPSTDAHRLGAVNAAQALRELPPESRLTGGAAAALIFSMVLPWYQVDSLGKDESRSALAVFTWVEAAILLVAAAVLYLVWARAQRRRFHLPGGDGFVVSLAGGWVLALLIWRLFDKPKIGGATTTVGIDWGIFVALLAAGALVAAGARVRAAGRPEPANPIAEETEWEVPPRRPRAANGVPREHTEVTQVLKERPPAWDGEPPPEPPGGRTGREPSPPDEPPSGGGRRRGGTPPADPPPDRLF